jgi:BirA family biotin operon repressor/biotin-[acetyl-CoA-carboxylase] ligase
MPTNDGSVVADTPAEFWEGCTAADLAGHWRLPRVQLFARAGSTNDIARKLAQSGAANATLVIAEEQQAGRGRGSRSWASPPGVGLWCSFILRDLEPIATGILPLRVALAVSRALDAWTGTRVLVKWPNDLLLGGRKLGGILCEASWDGHRLDHVVVGIGLNLLQGVDDFPQPIRASATSLRVNSERPVSRFEVAGDVVSAMRPLLFDRTAADAEEVASAFADRDALAGRQVDVRETESERVLLSGIASGIDDSGALLVIAGDTAVPIRSGTVRIRGD